MKRFLLSVSALSMLIPLSANAFGIQVIIDGKPITFKDVPTTAWYANYVHDAAQAGIVNGYKDDSGNLTGYFGPGNTVTIAEALKIAIEGAGYDVSSYSTVIPSGVDGWYSPYVSVAKGEGFAITSDGTVDYNRAATRAEVAQIFTDAFRVQVDLGASTPFRDVSPESAAAPSIAALSRDSVISGDTTASGQLTGTYRPYSVVFRSEMVKIVLNARTQYGERGHGRMPVQPME